MKHVDGGQSKEEEDERVVHEEDDDDTIDEELFKEGPVMVEEVGYNKKFNVRDDVIE